MNDRAVSLQEELYNTYCFFGLVLRGPFSKILELVDTIEREKDLKLIYRKTSPTMLWLITEKIAEEK